MICRSELLAGDVQDALPPGHLNRHLKHKRGLAYAGISAHQHDRAGDDAASKNARELSDRQGNAILGITADVCDGARLRTTGQAADRGRTQRRGRLPHEFLHHAVE